MQISRVLKTGTSAVRRGVACRDLADPRPWVLPAAPSETLRPIGYFTEEVDGDGASRVRVELFRENGLVPLFPDGASPPTADDIGKKCWFKDQLTVSLASASRSLAGVVRQVRDGRVWVDVAGSEPSENVDQYNFDWSDGPRGLYTITTATALGTSPAAYPLTNLAALNAKLAVNPQSLTATLSGTTANRPLFVTFVGLDASGDPLDLTLSTVSPFPVNLTGYAFSRLDSASHSGATGSGCNMALSTTNRWGFRRRVKTIGSAAEVTHAWRGQVCLSPPGRMAYVSNTLRGMPIVECWTAPPQADADAFVSGAALSTSAATVLSGAGLNGAVGAGRLRYSRNIVASVTVSGGAGTGTITIVVVNCFGERTTYSGSVPAATGNVSFSTGPTGYAIESVTVTQQTGTVTLNVGFGEILGFEHTLASQGGGSGVIIYGLEIDGIKVDPVTGTSVATTLAAPNGGYQPAAGLEANGSRSYLVMTYSCGYSWPLALPPDQPEFPITLLSAVKMSPNGGFGTSSFGNEVLTSCHRVRYEVE